MTVIVANDTPDAVRGLLKRWFIEPRPNVFVGTVNRRTREKTIAYIKRHAQWMGFILICSAPNSQGFIIEHHGDTNRRGVELSGLWLVAEEWPDTAKTPF
jgi:CRISPR-associated protein Cas2